MKNFHTLFTLLLLGGSLYGQAPGAPPQIVDANGAPIGSPALAPRTAQELEQLLGPIALYPDALIALILPASTMPTDIVLAARHLRENPGDRTQIEHRAWDESVKSLTNYPEVLMWMDENLQWTRQVGEAFAAQPADVMQAMQRLRAKARAAGTLVDTPQQQIITEQQIIRIVPVQPDVIYVPHYEPDIVFVDRPVYYTRPFLTFGYGVPVGAWLAFDCDWRRNTIWVGNRHRRWDGHDWRHPVVPIGSTYAYTRTPEVRQWRPAVVPPRPSSFAFSQRSRPEIVRPTPFSVTSTRSYSQSGAGFADRRNNPNPPSITNPTPRSYTPSSRAGYQSSGQRSYAPAVAPATVATPTDPSAALVQNVQPAPEGRRSGRPSSQPGDGASRNFRENQSAAAAQRSAAAPTVNMVPVAPPVTSAPNLQPLPTQRRNNSDGSQSNDARSRGFRGNQPAAVPPASAAQAAPSVTPAPPQYSAPVRTAPQASYSRAMPAPHVIPAQPQVSRSAPAPAVQPAPAPAPAAPAAQPAQQSSGGESRGHRGSYVRPGNANAP